MKIVVEYGLLLNKVIYVFVIMYIRTNTNNQTENYG